MSELTKDQFDFAATVFDQAVASGHIKIDGDGALIHESLENVQAGLEEARQERREERGASGTADQERLVLGFCVAGAADHREQWGEFRTLLGLQYSDELPSSLWTDKTAAMVAKEIDSTYRNRRSVQMINGAALIESMRDQIESKISDSSLQDFSVAVQALALEVDGVPASDFRISAEILRTRWGRQKIKRLGEQLLRDVSREVDVTKALEKATTELAEARDIFSGRIGNSYAFASAEDAWFQVEREMNRKHSQPIPTGIASIDLDIQGGILQNDAGKLHLLAARTGIGKSTLAIACAGGLAINGAQVLFLSCELNQKEIASRFLSNYAKQLYSQGRIRSEEANLLPQWRLEGRGRSGVTEQISSAYCRIMECLQEDKAGGGNFQSYAQFLAEADDFVEVMRAAKAKNPGISAVFLDHFHALRPTAQGPRDRSQEMEVRAQILHGAAKECEVDLFCLCQLNRAAADDPAGAKIQHINGTDALAQLCSVAWLLEYKKPDVDNGEKFDRGMLSLRHGKMRNGQRLGDRQVTVEESVLDLDRDHCWINSDVPAFM